VATVVLEVVGSGDVEELVAELAELPGVVSVRGQDEE
jgi:hypothetical protein